VNTLRVGAAALVIAAAISVVGSGVAASATNPSGADEQILAGLEADAAANPTIPGEVVAVRAPGLDVIAATGMADVDTGAPLGPETPFRIASVTKTFVAVAILRLVEQGKVNLDAPISRYISRASADVLRADGYKPAHIRVRQLLRHTAGLYDYAEDPAYDVENVSDPAHRWTRLEQLRFATDHGDPVAAPGAAYRYSDTAYVLLGEIIERVTHKTLPQAVRRLIGFKALGLDHTYWETLEPTPPGQRARAHQYFGTYDNIVLDASSDLYGGGGLVSTVSDLERFYRALFHGKVFHDAASLRTMTRVTGPGRDKGAGMGIFRVDVDGETCYGHRGYWGTQAIHCPRLDLTLVRTTNQADDSSFDSNPLERVIADLARRAKARD
jgi:D-alanyl-D-alanine carboxypeptidase